MHVPVMTREVLEYLAVRPDGVYLDATTGWGGHTALIAQRLEKGRVIANDRDAESLAMAQRNTVNWAGCIQFTVGPFSTLLARCQALAVPPVNGFLADLGVNRPQLTTAERGFSFQNDGPLDMRMDRTQDATAADLVNSLDEKSLADLIYTYGEERRSRAIAKAIVRARPLQTTAQLARLVAQVVPRTSKTDPATRTFQALRIAVNNEYGEIEALLAAVPQLVAPEARIVLIAFHGGEVRILKRFLQDWSRRGWARILTKHAVPPTEEEVRANPASRSAMLRAVEWMGASE